MAQSQRKIKEKNYTRVKEYLDRYGQRHRLINIPEGEKVVVFNPLVADWIARPLTLDLLKEIKEKLAPQLTIQLNQRGLVSAAIRQLEGDGDEQDPTNYHAVWTRDCLWIFWSYLAYDLNSARRLILSIWDYYSTPAQLKRFEQIIAKPSLAADPMAVPHIRFDGDTPDLGDPMVDGKPEHWSHKQLDAHGLFLVSLAHALQIKLLTPLDFNEGRIRSLTLLFHFLEKIPYYQWAEAGAWEEIDKLNTSSIGLAVRGLEVWRNLLEASREISLRLPLVDIKILDALIKPGRQLVR
ncbi:MAG: hypothetical protein WCG27_13370, partial [Pseudomonadota bacterium]